MSPPSKQRKGQRERGSLHLFRQRILKSRILWPASAYELRHTKLKKQPHEFRYIIPPQPPTQPSARPSSLRAFRMKVFSSELEQCGERERGGRRDKLIFEHFQTPLSPPSPAALHRVWCVRPGQVLTQARTFPSISYPAFDQLSGPEVSGHLAKNEYICFYSLLDGR